ncbi:hypothetical protein CDAR_256631 [Caerostris darwini]|uniref:Ribosomal protein S3 n=1 Tax=Caerostris darwini TaxID=1538125 RepID=A0AAV4PVY9_9ARAC|nr:hypothetical protein CDAR_256631 [Caerostris darwini]
MCWTILQQSTANFVNTKWIRKSCGREKYWCARSSFHFVPHPLPFYPRPQKPVLTVTTFRGPQVWWWPGADKSRPRGKKREKLKEVLGGGTAEQKNVRRLPDFAARGFGWIVHDWKSYKCPLPFTPNRLDATRFAQQVGKMSSVGGEEESTKPNDLESYRFCSQYNLEIHISLASRGFISCFSVADKGVSFSSTGDPISRWGGVGGRARAATYEEWQRRSFVPRSGEQLARVVQRGWSSRAFLVLNEPPTPINKLSAKRICWPETIALPRRRLFQAPNDKRMLSIPFNPFLE